MDIGKDLGPVKDHLLETHLDFGLENACEISLIFPMVRSSDSRQGLSWGATVSGKAREWTYRSPSDLHFAFHVPLGEIEIFRNISERPGNGKTTLPFRIADLPAQAKGEGITIGDL